MEKNTRLFWASVIALVTTAFGFIVRAILLTDLGKEFNLTQTQLGNLSGAGLFPFALSIILFSLIIDKVGYGRSMAIAWWHVVSAIITMTAHSYGQLYLGTFLFALSNGVVEAVVNPMVATMYSTEKVRRLNILHSGWAGGLVIGGLMFVAAGTLSWQYKIGLFLIPACVYGAMMVGCKFPVQERVTAGISYRDMLKEFGWASCLLISYFGALAVNAVLGAFSPGSELSNTVVWVIALVPTIIFAATIRSFGRPMFVFVLVIMILLATTELGTDSWVSDLLATVLKGNGLYVLIYTSAIMFVLRLFSVGPVVRILTPLGLLTVCSLLAAVGLYLLSGAGAGVGMIFIAATLYGVGKTYFWPTTLGLVSEQFPRGGAMTINGVGGMGMIAVGVLGAPFLGALQDKKIDVDVEAKLPAIHAAVAQPAQTFSIIRGLSIGPTFQPLDKLKIEGLPADQKAAVTAQMGESKQHSLAQFAVIPVLMAIGFGILLAYMMSKGGYKAVALTPGAKSEGAH